MKISVGWQNLAKKNNIKLRVSEVMPLCSFFLEYPNREELYTFFTKKSIVALAAANPTFSDQAVLLIKLWLA